MNLCMLVSPRQFYSFARPSNVCGKVCIAMLSDKCVSIFPKKAPIHSVHPWNTDSGLFVTIV